MARSPGFGSIPCNLTPSYLIGPPGIGKTAIMEQIAEECGVGLVAYTMTHHTRQSAMGLPEICTRGIEGKMVHTTEYTMSEIIASIYDCMEHEQHDDQATDVANGSFRSGIDTPAIAQGPRREQILERR